jgi:arylsulfatase A-like enzyme
VLAPGSWTLPVHASLFTGLDVATHGADFAFDGTHPSESFDESFRVRPLGAQFETLAERLGASGYQTLLVSGNPILEERLGLAQGFDVASVDGVFSTGPPAFAAPRLTAALAALDLQRRLFAVVNISVAHAPYELPGSPAFEHERGGIELFSRENPRQGLLVRFVTDGLSERERSDVLREIRGAYAWGVHLADRDLGRVVGVLSRGGWLDESSVLVVLSDHGELLGEHGRLDHGRSIEPEVTDTFGVVVGPGIAAGERSDTLLQTQALYGWLLDRARGNRTRPDAKLRSVRERSAWVVSLPDRSFLTLTGGRLGRRWEVGGIAEHARVHWWRDLDGTEGASSWPLGAGGETAARELEIAAGRLGARLAALPGARVDDLPEETRRALRSVGYLSP